MPDSEYTITVTSLQHVKKLENTVVLRTLKVPSMPELGIRDVRSTTVQLFWTRALESTTGQPLVTHQSMSLFLRGQSFSLGMGAQLIKRLVTDVQNVTLYMNVDMLTIEMNIGGKFKLNIFFVHALL